MGDRYLSRPLPIRWAPDTRPTEPVPGVVFDHATAGLITADLLDEVRQREADALPRRTALDPEVQACATDGLGHDYRPHRYRQYGRAWVSLRCVWCGALACGDPDQTDPCLHPYHHREPHRSGLGVEWPIGGSRPGQP